MLNCRCIIIVERSDAMTINDFKKQGAEVYDKMPKGWVEVSNTNTQPKGYVWVSNNKSLLGGERKHGLLKTNDNDYWSKVNKEASSMFPKS